MPDIPIIYKEGGRQMVLSGLSHVPLIEILVDYLVCPPNRRFEEQVEVLAELDVVRLVERSVFIEQFGGDVYDARRLWLRLLCGCGLRSLRCRRLLRLLCGWSVLRGGWERLLEEVRVFYLVHEIGFGE